MEVLSDTVEKDKKAYELALTFLVNIDKRVSPAVIEQHVLESEYNRPDNMADIFKRLIDSARNAQMKRNVIGDIQDLKEALCDYNPSNVLQKYDGDPKQLLDYIVTNVKVNDTLRLTDKSIWPRYCRSIMSSASFLSRFNTAKEFHDFVEFFHVNAVALPALPLMISKEVYGIGFALACDFLKEVGYQNYAKPDVHLKRILPALNLCDSPDEYVVFKSVVRIARNANATPYAVDKVFWLIGSGDFYRSGFRVGRHADEFIEWARPQLRI